MIEICKNLYIGNQDDYEDSVKHKFSWYVVHACKEPYHREALGYTGRAAPKTHPEYLIARRPNRLVLNLIDADDYRYIPKEIINAALQAIHNNISTKQVLTHCNQGASRSPSIGLLYLANRGKISDSFSGAVDEFKKLYPVYTPAKGIRDFMRLNWEYYISLKL